MVRCLEPHRRVHSRNVCGHRDNHSLRNTSLSGMPTVVVDIAAQLAKQPLTCCHAMLRYLLDVRTSFPLSLPMPKFRQGSSGYGKQICSMVPSCTSTVVSSTCKGNGFGSPPCNRDADRSIFQLQTSKRVCTGVID